MVECFQTILDRIYCTHSSINHTIILGIRVSQQLYNLILLSSCTKRLNNRGLEGIRATLLLNKLKIRALLTIYNQL